MVNTGKPSRGCDACKTLHTKCDERRPKCTRCHKAGRQCTGYKSDFDSKLRHQTLHVSRRMRARNDDQHFQCLRASLPIPYEPQAVALFLDNFVLDSPELRYSKGFLAGLVPLLRASKPDSLLASTVDAVGLCFLARSAANKSMASHVAGRYLRCLNRLQTTLHHQTESVSTETMTSVYLMGLYEMMMPPEKTVHPWLAHLSGLTAIRRARYKEPSRSFSGVGLFLTLDDSPDKSARGLIYDTPVDDWFIDNSTRNERLFDSMFVTRHGFEPPPSTDRRPAAVSDPVNDLNARTQNILQPPELSIFESSDPQAREKVKALLAAARSQLSSFRDWPARLPDGWQPKAIPTTHLEPAHLSHELDLYPGRIDIYPSLYIAAVWNTYRTTLLRLYDLITQCGEYLETEASPFHATEEYQSLRQQAHKTAGDICSSVAFHINNDWLWSLSLCTTTAATAAATSSTTAIATPNCTHQGKKNPKALGALFLIWPLYGGSVLSIVPTELRAWMRRKLRALGTTMGLAQASVLADTVDLWKRTDPHKTLVITQGHVFMWSAGMF